MNLLAPALLALGVAATTIMFAVVAFVTRATWRRVLGALFAAIPVIPLVMFFDAIAARLGWWRYPSVTTASAPLAWYIAAAVWYGAALGLVGWRVIRCFGTRGLVVIVPAFALFGLTRDYLYSITTGLIVFGEGAVPLLADWTAYGLAAALVQLLMYRTAGPPRFDPLARVR